MFIWIDAPRRDAGDRRTRMGRRTPIAARRAEAHGAKAAGVDPATRLVELVVLGRPHLVLPDVPEVTRRRRRCSRSGSQTGA